MIETIALALLIALGSVAVGVLIGRYYVPDDRALKRAAGHGQSYLRAIDHLLSRNRDGAIEEIRRVVEDDVDDLEPYFALAALFRQRGEWERAIRVHQAIELRGSDDADIRLRCLYELGLDFRAAGMPRRATAAMEECLRENSDHTGALRALSGLYEEQGRFAEAAEAWQRITRKTKRSPREIHLWAAAAQRALSRGDDSGAREHARKALKLGAEDPHALIAAAQVDRASGDHRQAHERMIRAVAVSPDLVAYALPALLDSAAHLAGEGRTPEDHAAAALITAAEAAHPNDVPIQMAIAELEARSSETAGRARLDDLAAEHPDLLIARVRAAQLALAEGDGAAIERELQALAGDGGALSFVLERRWRCASCARVQDRFYWRCPSCRHWATAEIDSGAPRAPFEPRDRRQFQRRPDGSVLVADDGLPDATISAPPRGGEEPGRAAAALRKAGSWLSGAVDSLRRK